VSDIKVDLDYRMASGHRAWRNVSTFMHICSTFRFTSLMECFEILSSSGIA
jgi:hypothetical protein